MSLRCLTTTMSRIVAALFFLYFEVLLANPIVLDGERLRKVRNAGDGRGYLVLCHAIPVNSKESEAALEVWKALEHPLSGIADVLTLNCDDFPTECHMLQAAHFPQVVLLVGGEILMYSGPITSKALYLFATNNIASPVAQLNSKNVEWWLNFETEGRTPVFLLHDNFVLPVAYSALARSLYRTHAFAEIRTVSDSVRTRFGVENLPAIAKGSSQDDTYTLYEGEFKRKQLRAFLLGEEEVEEEQGGWPAGVVPAETFGIPHLTLASASDICEAMCTVVLLPDGVSSAAIKERRRRMEAARDLSKALAKLPKRANSAPKLVWASRFQKPLFDALQACASEGEVALAVWKVKRNRAAVSTAPLTAQAGVRFVEAVMTGDASFVLLAGTSQMLLGGAAPPPSPPEKEEKQKKDDEAGSERGLDWFHGRAVPPGFLDWAAPTNLLAEREDQESVPTWAGGQSAGTGGEEGQEMGGETAGDAAEADGGGEEPAEEEEEEVLI